MATKAAENQITKKTVENQFSDFTENDQYKTDKEVIPWIQALNKSEDLERAGLFISQENVKESNFSPDENWEPFKKRFGKSDTVEGFRTITPNFSIIHSSPLFMRNREGEKVYVPYNKETYNSKLQTCVTRYLLLLLSKDNKPLHYTPIQFTAKGSVCGSFGTELRKIREEINKLVGREMGPRFFALWRNALQLDVALKGKDQESSWVTTVAGHEPMTGPTHFFGRNTETKELIETLFDQYIDFGKLTKANVEPEPEEEAVAPEQEFAEIPF